MNAILLPPRTGMQWNVLSATGTCGCSSAYRRFREWVEAGVFLEFWRRGLLAYDVRGPFPRPRGEARQADGSKGRCVQAKRSDVLLTVVVCSGGHPGRYLLRSTA
jgi:hypothetical protein